MAEDKLIKPEPRYPVEDLICEICHSAFPEDLNVVPQLRDLPASVRAVHQACPPCGLVYVQVVTASYSSNCDECQVQFKSFRGLRQHMGRVHSAEEKKVVCEECHKTFKHKYAVKFHVQQVHERSSRVNCEECGKEFSNKYILQTHVKTQH